MNKMLDEFEFFHNYIELMFLRFYAVFVIFLLSLLVFILVIGIQLY
jgi:hypothetical protein